MLPTVARRLSLTRMTAAAQRSSMERSVSSPTSNLAPSFYRSEPPPHWINVPKPKVKDGSHILDVSRRSFKSPWSSASDGSLIAFLRGRLFDWDEVPLPPKKASKQGGSELPTVLRPTWHAEPGTSESKHGITFTWLGHAGVHLQIPTGSDGHTVTVLCDPVLSRRCSPFQWLGPERFTESPTSVEDMIEATITGGRNAWPDALVLSHNHYDHTDYHTVSKLLSPPPSSGLKPPHVFCTLGTASWFETNFRLPSSQITECDWWQQTVLSLDGTEHLRLTCVPAQHFSGRGLFDRDRTLWAGWTFEGLSGGSTVAKAYFAGDTGYRTVPRGVSREEEDKLDTCPAFKEIGELLGPFDLSLIPIGAYLPRWLMSGIHAAPQDSVRIHREVKSRRSFGIHWASFRLTPEDVNEPPRLLFDEAQKLGLQGDEFTTVKVGESVFIEAQRQDDPLRQAPVAVEPELDSAPADMDEPLPESKLGTKAHWDSVYEREVTTFNDIGEEGEVWFGEDSVMRMIRHLEKHYDGLAEEEASGAPAILDLGTGNGHLLFEMLESSAELEDIIEADKMVGVDYSDASIQLAKAVGERRGGDCTNVKFLPADLMDASHVEKLTQLPAAELGSSEPGWDIVCDKGTLDAIALSSQPIGGKMPIELYTLAVQGLVKAPRDGRNGGIFLITSCNFTEKELVERFTRAGFEVDTVIPTPTFTFGGAKGSSTTSIAFRRA